MRHITATTAWAAWMVIGASLSGCGGAGGGGAEGEGEDIRSLARAEEEVWGFLPKPEASKKDESIDKPIRITRKPQDPEPRPRPRPISRPREPKELSGVLVRGGMLMTLSSKEGEWGPAGSFGLGYRWGDGTSAKQVFDFGMDFATIEDTEGEVTSSLVLFRAEALFGKWNSWRSSTIVYFLGGAHLLLANSEWENANQTDAGAATGFELGVGVGASSGRWELRTVYSFLAGSQNVDGNLLIAAGFSL